MSGVAGRLGIPQGGIVINASRLHTNGASSSSSASSSAAARFDITLPPLCTGILQLSEVLLRRLGVATLLSAETTPASRLEWLQVRKETTGQLCALSGHFVDMFSLPPYRAWKCDRCGQKIQIKSWMLG
jgi:hypothetical protein